jgi:hypothetical protein
MPRTGLPRLILAAAILGGVAGPVAAHDARFAGRGEVRGYGAPYSYAEPGAVGYGYADEAVRGAYVGAPLTRFPRPSEIVPPAWSYGTYGIPTVAGIARAQVGEPTLTVIHAQDPAPRRNGGARILSRAETGRWARIDARAQTAEPAGARIIEVRVPRR